VQALLATGGVQIHAANLIEMPVRTFVTKLKRYRIAEAEWRQGGAVT
jgi:DNA-binding NtrC family response regulator